MICPVCGCQQRETEVCVQCHAPLFAKIVDEQDIASVVESQSSSIPRPPLSSEEKITSKSSPENKSISKADSSHILITTTQRVEGKRIVAYYGLIHADVIIKSGDLVFSTSQDPHRKRFKKAIVDVLKDLREEAAMVHGNTVIATSFDYQRIDPETILLSALGTAVLVKDR